MVKDNRIIITVPIETTNPAVPGPVKLEPDFSGADVSTPAGATTGQGAKDHDGVSTADEIGEVISESEDSDDALAEAQGTDDEE